MDTSKIEAIQNLKPGERVEISATKDKVAELELLYLKMSSYENLFLSFMTRTPEDPTEFSLQKFMDAYTELTVREYFLSKELVEPELGEGGFTLIKCAHNHLALDIDSHNKKLFVLNNMPLSCADCKKE